MQAFNRVLGRIAAADRRLAAEDPIAARVDQLVPGVSGDAARPQRRCCRLQDCSDELANPGGRKRLVKVWPPYPLRVERRMRDARRKSEGYVAAGKDLRNRIGIPPGDDQVEDCGIDIVRLSVMQRLAQFAERAQALIAKVGEQTS
jgi:hypothetical protein